MTEKRDLTRDVLSIYIPAFFIMTGMSIASPILTIYAKSFDVSYVLASLVVSVYAMARLIADLPAGILGDRVGRKPVLLIGTIVVTASAFLCANAGSFWELIFYRLLQGVGASMWQIMRATMLQDVLKPEERGRIIGYFQAFMLIGSSSGPTIGGIVAENWGIRAPFYFYGLGSLVCLVLSYFLISETGDTHGLRRNNSMEEETKEEERFSWSLVKKLLGNVCYCSACFATFTMLLMRQGIRNTLIPLYGSVELNLGAAEIGYAISLATLANLIIIIPMGHALDKLGRKTVLIPILTASAVVLTIFPFAQDFTQLSMVCFLLGLSDGGGGQATLTMASDVTMDEPHGISMGLYRVFSDIGFVVGPLMVGALTDAYGLRFPFYVVSFLVFASMLIIQVFAKETLPRKKKQEAGRSE